MAAGTRLLLALVLGCAALWAKAADAGGAADAATPAVVDLPPATDPTGAAGAVADAAAAAAPTGERAVDAAAAAAVEADSDAGSVGEKAGEKNPDAAAKAEADHYYYESLKEKDPDAAAKAASANHYYYEAVKAKRFYDADPKDGDAVPKSGGGSYAAQQAARAKLQARRAERRAAQAEGMGQKVQDTASKTVDSLKDMATAASAKRTRIQQDAERIAQRARRDVEASKVKTAAGDSNELCGTWAHNGECMRNPQFMYSACANSCNAQVYVDTQPECATWTEAGECENNPDFMLDRCNASCVVEAKKKLMQPRQERRNPHLRADDDDDIGGSGASRLWTFVPVFLFIVCILGGIFALTLRYEAALAEREVAAEEAYGRFVVKMQRHSPAVAQMLLSLNINAVGRACICLYFLNEGLTVLQTNPRLTFLLSSLFNVDGVWQEHQVWVDVSNVAGGVAGALCVLYVRPLAAAAVMLADIIIDSYLILMRIVMTYMFGHGLYINELMAKKFSLMGCVAMLIAVIVQARQRKASFPGLLMEASSVSSSLSLALLIARLSIAVLFLYVGLSELHRLLFQPTTPYLPGDGHDVVWPKAVELLLAVPFTLGFHTTTVSRLLALSLVVEAFYAWSWWSMSGDPGAFSQHRRVIHYREHFMTNVATAGGLLLLQKLGPGKYTVDELLKKKD